MGRHTLTPAGTVMGYVFVARDKATGEKYTSGNLITYFSTEEGLRRSLRSSIRSYKYKYKGYTEDNFEILECVICVTLKEEEDE